MNLQSVIQVIYPPQCVGCETETEDDGGLCSDCWAETQFIHGAICDRCGAPLPGDDAGDLLTCDDCMRIARPWDKGRAALVYAGKGRALVLALKHGDRTELARPAARWMAGRLAGFVDKDTVCVPVPLHWMRMIKRRYNQAALLADEVSTGLGLTHVPDALRRPHATKPLDGHNRAARFDAIKGQIVPNARRMALIKGRPVLLIDDVMTSGATLAAGAEALHAMGASRVCVATLARVVKDA